jgi:hypothetical protein
MQPVSPHRWRALPTALIVIGAIALGAATARAEAHRVPPPGGSVPGRALDGGAIAQRAPAASTSAAIR